MGSIKRLSCAVQNYAWGKKGTESEVAKLCAANDWSFLIDSEKPYAELWMGTHAKGPSQIMDDSISLSEYIQNNPSVLGPHENGSLQFLFKVLSVEKALSIQSHPTKEQAERLHRMDPENYPDANHKPEMAIALTPFELLCGFRPAIQISSLLNETPELKDLLNNSDSAIEALNSNNAETQREALQRLFSAVMNLADSDVSSALTKLMARLNANVLENDKFTNVNGLLKRLNEQFAGDIGVFAAIFLNHFKLERGEACFLGPNEPHAYIYGDCIECMACSDNTIRAGLTPKFRDIQTLCTSLTYRMATEDSNKISPVLVKETDGLVIWNYCPPVDEFAVHRIQTSNDRPVQLAAITSSSILLIVAGEAVFHEEKESAAGLSLKRGSIIFIPANLPLMIVGANGFEAYRAFRPQDKKIVPSCS